MKLFEISSILISFTALASFANHKWIKLPSAIGLFLFAILFGLIGIAFKKLGLTSYSIEEFTQTINFQEVVFHGMLSFLLFAGALQINLQDLKSTKIPIALTAVFSTLISTVIIGYAFYFFAKVFAVDNINLLEAFLFGAILSPTDPIAVLAIIKKLGVSKRIETMIVGESLFNDGIAIVLFICILELMGPNDSVQMIGVFNILFNEVVGGVAFGGLLGWVAYRMIISIDAYPIELLITIAVATGGYALADYFKFSAPLAMVIAGLIIGNHGRARAMSVQTRKYIDFFWEIVDEILNAILFLLIGFEVMTLKLTENILYLSLFCIVIALVARFISLAIPLTLMKPFYKFKQGTTFTLTWGGLRGGLSIAMVLSLNSQHLKIIFLPCIFFVVFFSIVIQGLTFSRVLKLQN